ncbi:MAG: calcium-binding protein, partial [Pirellulaceae bacterium]
NDTIFAGNGNDTVSIGNSDTGDKLVYMDKLQDYLNIISTTGNHIAYLGENNDNAFLEANSGNIQVFGESGNDKIYAQNFGSDTLDGGNDDDEVAIGDGSIGRKSLIGGFGDDTIDVQDSSGYAPNQILPNTQVSVNAGEGTDTVHYHRGLFLPDENNGGDDNDTITFEQATWLILRDKSIENFETINWSGEDDSVVFADGNNTRTGGAAVTVNGNSGEDFIDASRETASSYVLNGGDYSDTLKGGAAADSLRGGSDEDLLTGGGGADQFRMIEQWNSTSYSDVIQDFTGNLDKLVFNGNAFSDISAIDGYKGTAGNSATANDNLLIATGQSYTSLAEFDAFLTAGTADTDKPGFYIFFNGSANRGEIWFDTSMVSTDGAVLVATFNNITAVNQLAQFNEGPSGGNSGDFVII